ncbi:MAG: hypothetical protein ACYCYA_12545 [Actinomycetes bacterium]
MTGDDDVARPCLERAGALAAKVKDRLIRSCVERHLGFIDARAGRQVDAGKHLQASVELRRQIGFDAGVASGLLALAELAAETGEGVEAAQLLAEATDLAQVANLDPRQV